jgi:hypothetical protein
VRTLSFLTAVVAAVFLPAAAQARDVTQTAEAGEVSATLTYHVARDVYSQVRLRIARSGTVVSDQQLRQVTCGRGCAAWVPGPFSVPGPVKLRDLDADGEPEVIVDFYTGGAHCCVVTAFYRWSGSAYRRSVEYFGNYGYRIVDLDRDGTPELSAYDERFAYAFGSYADSLSPPVVRHWQADKLVDVTRRFPALIRANAKLAFRLFARSKRRHDPIAARAVLVAWTADQCLLGRCNQGFARVGAARRAGDLGTAKESARYVAQLRTFLKRAGYLA